MYLCVVHWFLCLTSVIYVSYICGLIMRPNISIAMYIIICSYSAQCMLVFITCFYAYSTCVTPVVQVTVEASEMHALWSAMHARERIYDQYIFSCIINAVCICTPGHQPINVGNYLSIVDSLFWKTSGTNQLICNVFCFTISKERKCKLKYCTLIKNV